MVIKATLKIKLWTLGKERKVLINNEFRQLSPQQFALLVYIVHNNGKCKRRDLANTILKSETRFGDVKNRVKVSLGVDVFQYYKGKDAIELRDDLSITTDALELKAACKVFDLQKLRLQKEEPLLFLESLNKQNSPTIKFESNFKKGFKEFVINQREILSGAIWNVYLHYAYEESDNVDQLLEEALYKTGELPPPTEVNGSYKRLRYLHYKYKSSLENHPVTDKINKIDKKLGEHGYFYLPAKEINDYLSRKQKEDELTKLKVPSITIKESEEITITETVSETIEEDNPLPVPKVPLKETPLTQKIKRGFHRLSLWVLKKWWLAILLVSFLLTVPFLLQSVVDRKGNKKCQFNSRQILKRNADWTPVECDFSNAMMVLVPRGSFIMGSESGEDDEKPTVRQEFNRPFWIDKTEVTRIEYEICVLEGVCTHTKDSEYSTAANQPINRVTWQQATTYCKWRDARLPTEAEWEYAARGPSRLVFPWGNEFDKNKVNYAQTSNNQTASVGSYPSGASWVGALDMSGNVWEWTRSLYRSYPYKTDSRELAGDEESLLESVTLRSSSFGSKKVSDLRSAARVEYNAAKGGNYIGFRCVHP